MRFLSLALVLVSLAAPALACPPEAVQGGYCAEDLQVQAYAAPVRQLEVQAYVQPVQQVRVVQRVVVPQAVYVQPQRVVLNLDQSYAAQAQLVAPYFPAQAQRLQQRIASPYVRQQLNVSSGYSSQQQLNSSYSSQQQLNLGSRQRLNLGAGGSQRSVVKSRTVTKSGAGGLVGRLLGR